MMRLIRIPIVALLLAAAALAQDPADPPPAGEAVGAPAPYLVGGPREMFARGVELAERGAVQEAKAVFKALTVAYPELPEPYINLAVLLAAEGGEDEAAVAAEAAIRVIPLCRAAFDLEFQQQLGSYGEAAAAAAVPGGAEPAPEAVEPAPETAAETVRSLGPSDLPGAARAAAPETGGSPRVVRDIDSCLKLRARPGVEAETLDCRPAGAWVLVRATEGEWSRVALADGRQGWMAASFLVPGPFRVVGEAGAPCLNFRPRPEAGAAPRGCLPPGTRVLVREAGEEWSRVVLEDGREGWMATPYLAPDPASRP